MKRGSRWVRWAKGIVAVGIVVIVPVGLLAFCVGSPAYYSAKYASAGPSVPTALPMPLVPERQIEAHTCGWHAIRSIYRAYGIDPDVQRLRFRLGTDKPFTNFVPDSTGTIHPDILRVMGQDRFEIEMVNPSSATAAEQIRAHLALGHVALTLIDAPGLHWIVLERSSERGQRQDTAMVCDSLSDTNYPASVTELCTHRAVSVLLVKPR